MAKYGGFRPFCPRTALGTWINSGRKTVPFKRRSMGLNGASSKRARKQPKQPENCQNGRNPTKTARKQNVDCNFVFQVQKINPPSRFYTNTLVRVRVTELKYVVIEVYRIIRPPGWSLRV